MSTEIPNVEPSFIRRTVLRLMAVMIGVCIAACLAALLRGDALGEVLPKLIRSTALISVLGLLGMSCAEVVERNNSRLAVAGAAASCVAMVLYFICLWLNPEKHSGWWKAMGISIDFALALWRAARLTLAKFDGWRRVVVRATMGASLGIAIILTMLIVLGQRAEVLVPLMNVLWVVAVSGHLFVIVLQRARDD